MGNSPSCSSDVYAGMDVLEARLLENVFDGLASRSPGRTMDKKTFLNYVDFHGMFGERLFDAFDTKKNNLIDLEEFLTGITRFLNGSNQEKIQLLFKMFDLRSNDKITLDELRTMVYSMLQHDDIRESVSRQVSTTSVQSSLTKMDTTSTKIKGEDELGSWKPKTGFPSPNLRGDTNANGQLEDKTNAGKSSGGSATSTPAKQHPFRPPAIDVNAKLTEDVKLQSTQSPAKPKSFVEAEKVDDYIKNVHDENIDAQTLVAENLLDHTLVTFAKGKSFLTFAEFSDWIQATPQITNFMETTLRAHVFKKAKRPRTGYLKKRGKTFKTMLTRYCVIQDSFLYMFKTDKELQRDQKPGNAIFLAGLRVTEPKEHQSQHGIQLESNELSRVFFARNEQEKRQWLVWLREESKHEELEDEYEMKGKLGAGRFATVYKCTHKKTGRDYAVKVIDKTQIDDADKEGLRAEIAILRLASHPFIVSMKKVFETKKNIYIVMEWLEHGDLFKTIVNQKFFAEDAARHVIQQLCSAIRYCHLRGIVHKDIKPENILVENLDGDYIRIFVTDFGLSQFAKPAEEMKDAAGSVAYMAPEMIDSDTFTKSVDVWGIGVITFVLLSGSLPFYDKDEIKLMDKIVEAPVEFKQSRWKGVSEKAKDFVTKMLAKDPKKRLNISEAMAHPWLAQVDKIIPLLRRKTHQPTDRQASEKKEEIQEEKKPSEKSS
mmetsp:Transcript_16369/g.27024  ORF Transcript_16369/g.27024 Transcript_16369/m.27024 type:complete len:714 (-) Transcript_16369:135-2276(-)